MITIQSAMLIALGFFLACCAVFLLAPLYRRRAARLATDALRRSMPLTEAEIRADKDRLRAEHAIAIHKLEAKAEESALSAARQMVEINRRDAAISALESASASMRTSLEEHENARRVLEQTITDRLPRVESRLTLAKKQLFQRDQEIASLTQSSGKYSQALEEATQINTQQRDEIHRLNATITTRAARNREPMGADARFDSEVALRSEIEALRAKARDQSAMISRLQTTLSGGTSPNPLARNSSAMGHNNGTGVSAAGEEEVQRLRDSLSEAEMALRAARSGGPASAPVSETELRSLKAVNQDQQAEIARLKAALRAYEAEDADDRAVLDSKIAMKARLSSLQAQTDLHNATIHSLRAEIAAANEKLARQASQYMDEMRRLGAGSMPASGPHRRDSYEASSSLAARISAPRPVTGNGTAASNSATSARAQPTGAADASVSRSGAEAVPAAVDRPISENERVSSNFLRALTGSGGAPVADPAAREAALESPSDAAIVETGLPVAARRRPGLLERLTNAEKPAASGG